MANVLGRRFVYVVDDVEEGHTTFQRSSARHVATGKQPLSKDIHGELEIFVEKEFAKTLAAFCQDN